MKVLPNATCQKNLLKVIFILLSFIALDSINAQQRVYYRYRLYPSIGDELRQGLQAMQAGRAAHANISIEIAKARHDFFKALKNNSSDIKEKETYFYQTLFVKDIHMLNDFKFTDARFEGKPVPPFWEIIFGKIDEGVHPRVELKFKKFAKAYIGHEYRLSEGNPLKVTKEIALKALQLSEKEYSSYRVARDWIEFEKQGLVVSTGEDRYKMRIVGLIHTESDEPLTYEEGEEQYNVLKKLIGIKELNKLYDVINETFYVNDRKYGFHDRSDMIYNSNYIISGTLDYFGERIPKVSIIYDLNEFAFCRRDLSCTYKYFKYLESVYGEQKLEAAINKISNANGFFKDFMTSRRFITEPRLKIGEEEQWLRFPSLFKYLAYNDLEGYGKLVLLYSNNDEFQNINDLKINGEEHMINSLLESLKAHNFLMSRERIASDLIDLISTRKFDYSNYEKLPGSYSGDIDEYFYKKGTFTKDTFILYSPIINLDPKSNYKNVDNVGRGICLFSKRNSKDIPNVIIVKLIKEDWIHAEYMIENKTDFIIVTYIEKNQRKEYNVSNIISKYSHSCIYEKHVKEREAPKEAKSKKLAKEKEIKANHFYTLNIKEKIALINKWYKQIEHEEKLVKSKTYKKILRGILLLDDFFIPFYGVSFKELDREKRLLIIEDLALINKRKKYKKAINEYAFLLLYNSIKEDDKSHKSQVYRRYTQNQWVRKQYKNKKRALQSLISGNGDSSQLSGILKNTKFFDLNRVLPSEKQEFIQLVEKYKNSKYYKN